MANKEHLEILEQGVEVWNKWRKDNIDLKPDLQDIDLREEDLEKVDFWNTNLENAVLRNANLQEAVLQEANLQSSDLKEANLQNAKLFKADLRNANLEGADFYNASLQNANLSFANLKKTLLSDRKVNLQKANLQRANLQRADLWEADLKEAILNFADLREANLFEADLRGAILGSVNFEGTKVSKVKYDNKTQCEGDGFANCLGNPLFKRFAQDEDYIVAVKIRHPLLYWLWWISSDCGRSFCRWAVWSLFFAFYFALNFYWMGEDSFAISYLPWEFTSLLYYSVVTFTTLGFGDIVPKTTSAAYWVMVEVILGFIMLGGLISIFADKLARRS